MFKPTYAKDRLNYGDVLMPPIGYHIVSAVGTTYSLDLETLTAVSIALGLAEDTDSELTNNPISLLTALQKVADKIVIFCEAGQIKLPAETSSFCLMLEKMVVPVSIPFDKRINRFPAFHPKTWFLEYGDNDGNRKYRFLILSRNMTFDHSWDIAYSMDGETTDNEDAGTQPMIAFLRFLKKQLNKEFIDYAKQNEILTHMLTVLPDVHFTVDSRFAGYMVMPMGIGAEGYNMSLDSLFRENYHELVVMSPFLSGSIIQEWNMNEKSLNGTKRTLITRRSELPKIQGVSSNFDIYVMKDEVIDGESSISDGEEIQEQEDVYKQDIHAKIFIRRKHNTVDLYLGSMNASYAAAHSNVEMMIRLRTKPSILTGEKFLDDIMGTDRNGMNPFELVVPDSKQESEGSNVHDKLERKIKEVCRIKMIAHAMKTNDDFQLRISADMNDTLEGVTIRPLQGKKECELRSDMIFDSLHLMELSEFYVVSAFDNDDRVERVIMIPTSGIPEERDTEIIRSIIKSKRQFLEYVAFVLGDDYIQSFLENQLHSGTYGEWGPNGGQTAVYEKMLRTAVTDPDRLKEIQQITRAVEDESIIPKEFREVYSVFCNTLGIRQE